MALGSPTAQAFRFVLDSNGKKYDAYMDLVEHVDFHVLDVRYKEQGSTGEKWTWLVAPEVNPDKLGNEIETRIHLQELLDEYINPKIQEVFNVSDENPVSGFELVRWFLSNAFHESDNVIKIIT